jgi:Spy/CpxP family protein refolding chaperone
MHKSWQQFVAGLIVAGSLVSVGLAQEPGAAARGSAGRPKSAGSFRPGGFGFLSSLNQALGLTPEQRDSIHGLLAAQREQSQALREQTDAKIRAVLNPDQQKKFDQVLAEQKEQRARRFTRPS